VDWVLDVGVVLPDELLEVDVVGPEELLGWEVCVDDWGALVEVVGVVIGVLIGVEVEPPPVLVTTK
jgi:hypothetical protein